MRHFWLRHGLRNQAGGELTTLHIFENSDANRPIGDLVLATDGNFYGTTLEGGAHGGNGTVFKISPQAKLTTLHKFDMTDGESSNGLLQAANGNFYSTAGSGGKNDVGTFSVCRWVLFPSCRHYQPQTRWERPSLSWETI